MKRGTLHKVTEDTHDKKQTYTNDQIHDKQRILFPLLLIYGETCANSTMIQLRFPTKSVIA